VKLSRKLAAKAYIFAGLNALYDHSEAKNGLIYEKMQLFKFLSKFFDFFPTKVTTFV